MTKMWSDVAASSAFQALTPEEQEEARQQYFEEVVAPQVPEDDLDFARGQFDEDTVIARRSPGPSTRGGHRGPAITQLDDGSEQQYRQWMQSIGHTKQAGFNVDDNFTGGDYDYRGFFKKNGPVDIAKGQHFTDEFKLPNHETFSDESRYAVGADRARAGHWEDDKFVPAGANPLPVDPRISGALEQNDPSLERALVRLPGNTLASAKAQLKESFAGARRFFADLQTRMDVAKAQAYRHYQTDDPRVQASQERGAQEAEQRAGAAELEQGRAQRMTRRAQAEGQAAVPADAGPVERAVQSGVSSAMITVPIVTIGATVPGGQAPALAALGGMTGASRYGELRAAGVDEGSAAVSAAALGGLESLTEAIPLGTLAKKSPFMHDAMEFLVQDLLGENVSSLAQIADDYRLQLRDDVTMGDIQRSLKETTASTIVGAGAQLSVSGLMNAVVERANQRAQQRTPQIQGPTAEEIQAGANAPQTDLTNYTPPDSLSAQVGLTPIVVPNVSPAKRAEVAQEFGLDQMQENPHVGPTDAANAVPAAGGASAGADLAGGVAAAGSAPAVGGQPVVAGAPVGGGQQAGPVPGEAGEQTAPLKQWFGRAGDGYKTEGDAQQALPGRQRMHPELAWKIEQMPSGKYRLAGYGAQAAVQKSPSVQENEQLPNGEHATQRALEMSTAQMDGESSAALQAWSLNGWRNGKLQTDAPLRERVYASFEPLREALRAGGAKTVRLYRGVGAKAVDSEKRELWSWTSDQAEARGFAANSTDPNAPLNGGRVEEADIPIDDIVAARGTSNEFIVRGVHNASTDGEYVAFPPASGTRGIPRADMPQVKAEHRGALVNFLNARGVEHEQQEVPSSELKATQAEYSPAKVDQAKAFTGGDRSILVSSDGHIVDGHHQWIAKLDEGAPVKVIRLNAPIDKLLPLVHEFPSSTSAGESGVTQTPETIQTEAQGPQAPGSVATPGAIASAAPAAQTELRGPQLEGLKLAPTAPASLVDGMDTQLRRQSDVEIEQVSQKNMSAGHRVASAIARVFGKTLTVVKQRSGDPKRFPNGFINGYGGKHIFIAENTEDAPLSVTMHEIYHSIPAEQRVKLNQALLALTHQDKHGDFSDEYSVALEDVEEELPAYMVQAISKREDFWEQLREKMGNKEFGQVARAILDKLNELLTGFKSDYGDEFLQKYVKDIARARDLLTDAYAAAQHGDTEKAEEAEAVASNRHGDALKRWFGSISPDEQTLRAIEAVAKSPLAAKITVFGSVAKRNKVPLDIDLVVDASDTAMAEADWSKYSHLLKIARSHYGSVDPFIRFKDALVVRNDSATAWMRSKNAKKISAAIDTDGVQLVTISGDSSAVYSRRKQLGDFTATVEKDGSLTVNGDAEQIRALLPDDVIGRATKDGMKFRNSDASRVRAALEGRKVAYGRGGEVTERLPMKDGKYLGAPEKFDTPAKIPTLRKWLKQLALEGKPGRMWYENSSEEVLRMVGGDVQEARKFAALLAIYSPQAKVDTNATFALRAWAQYQAGQPINVKTRVMDQKATEALSDVDAFWSGEKTGNFVTNLLRRIDPSLEQGATIDMWMMRAAQYPTDAPGSTQYSFMENEVNRLAKDLGWEPQQVQAAIWVAMKARMENRSVAQRTEAKSEKKGWLRYERVMKDGKPKKVRKILNKAAHRTNWLEQAFAFEPTEKDTARAKFDFGDGLRRHIGQVSFEARPGRSTGVLPGAHDAPYALQLKFQQDVQKALYDKDGADLLAQKLGLLIDSEVIAPGVWMGEISPSTQTSVAMAPGKAEAGKSVDPAQAKNLNVYAAVLGLLSRQEGVGWHRPFPVRSKAESNGVQIDIGRPLNPREVSDLSAAIGRWMVHNGYVDWQDKFAFISSPKGIRLVNFGVVSNAQLQTELIEVAEGVLPDGHVDLFKSDGDMPTNDWKENPNGQAYVQRIRAAGRSDVLDWARDILAPRVQDVFERYSREQGWGDPGELRFSNRAAASAGEEGVQDAGRVRGSAGSVAGDRRPYSEPGKRGETLEGLPSRIEVDGQVLEFAGFKPAQDAARSYMKRAGLPYSPPRTYAKIDRKRARRIAESFTMLIHDPRNPEVKLAYQMMIKETIAQYREILGTGLQVEFIRGDDPYRNPRNAILDVVESNHLWVFPTSAGFGSDAKFDASENPLLAETEFKISGETALANDIFRVVHDYFGHVKNGVGFRAEGEENAWRSHSSMYSPLARRAMTSETRGQNSWVNFGPNAENNRFASGADTVYADQKIGLLPKWVSEEGASDGPVFSNRAVEPTFYSSLTRAAEQLKLTRASEAQWMATLRNQPGVKEEEIQWTGLHDWLMSIGRQATKQEVVDFLRANELQVEEVLKGEGRNVDREEEAVVMRVDDAIVALTALGAEPLPIRQEAFMEDVYSVRYKDVAYDYEPRTNQLLGDAYDADTGSIVELKNEKIVAAAKEWYDAGKAKDEYYNHLALDEPKEGDVKYARYTTPGGRNYRELLLTLPPKQKLERESDYQSAEESRMLRERNAQKAYRSSHWDEPNILTHVRFDERTDADGKRVLFIQEIQSDWHQQGRKRGYKSDRNPIDTTGWTAKAESGDPASGPIWAVRDANGIWIIGAPKTDYQTQDAAIARAAEVRLERSAGSRVPDAPLKTTWQEFAFKRMLRWAAENDFDRIAWTTGEMQAERYDLSKHVDAIEVAWVPRRAEYAINAYNGDERIIEAQAEDENEMADHIGKELAAKAVQQIDKEGSEKQQRVEFSGLDLKVGGEGMKGFYDDILPKFVNKYTKKWGGKVSRTYLKPAGESRLLSNDSAEEAAAIGAAPVHAVDITMPMREAALSGQPVFSNRVQREEPKLSNRQASVVRRPWVFERDKLGNFRFAAGARAYRLVADVANAVLAKVKLKPISSELGRAMRRMQAEIAAAKEKAAVVAGKLGTLSAEERELISDVIEKELRAGVTPPEKILAIAANMQHIMSEQTKQLVDLGMMTDEAANRWEGKYLPRFYQKQFKDELKAWARAAKQLFGKKGAMQGISGNSLKARGMFKDINVEELPAYEQNGWEVRDPGFDPADADQVTIWRDFTKQERSDMNEIRDSMFRFVMGYMRSQKDIALGRLYRHIARTMASRGPKDGYVQVPDTSVEGTTAKRYGELAGKWVPQEVLDHLSAADSSEMNEIFKLYLKGVSAWKEGRTVLNPVSHVNNVVSNVTMAHMAGVSYWDAHKYVGAVRDLVKKSPMIQEAKEAGLFGGTFNQADLLNNMPEQLKVMAGMSESAVTKAAGHVWNAMSFFLRKPLQKAYENEDLFFRYLIYRDARQRGLEPDAAVEHAQEYIFTYDDLPKGARAIRDTVVPFFSWTYKAIPALARTAFEYPWRFAAPAAVLWGANTAMYAIAGGDDDDDPWWEHLIRYVRDPEFRAAVHEMEEGERKDLPPWNRGHTAIGTPKVIRMGHDDVTNLPMFLDVSRLMPGGDMFDTENNAGGIPWFAPLDPGGPAVSVLFGMFGNLDYFTGKNITSEADTDAEAAEKRAAWMYQAMAPSIAPFGYHFNRAMNALAYGTDTTIDLGPVEYTGFGKDGLPVQPSLAALQTFGIKLRDVDLDQSKAIQDSQRQRLVRDISSQISSLKRLRANGAISDESFEDQMEKAREKKARLKQGLTVEGEEED